MFNLIGETIDPTCIDKEIVDGKQYWQTVPNIKYSIDGNESQGTLLIAPAIGFERSIVRTLEGKDFEMTPAYYSAEILLDKSFRMLTLRFYRVEVSPDKKVNRRVVDAIPSPIIEDFIPRVRRLMEGKLRIVRQVPVDFQTLAREMKSSASPSSRGKKKKSVKGKSAAKAGASTKSRSSAKGKSAAKAGASTKSRSSAKGKSAAKAGASTKSRSSAKGKSAAKAGSAAKKKKKTR